MRSWMEKWGSMILVLLCTLVILFSALYTRQDDLRRIAAQNAAADQNETLHQLTAYCPPVRKEAVRLFSGACKNEKGFWQLDPYVHYPLSQTAAVFSVCDGVVLAADAEQILLEADNQLLFRLRGAFSLLINAGDAVAAGQQIATSTSSGELLLSLSSDGHYLDPLSLF